MNAMDDQSTKSAIEVLLALSIGPLLLFGMGIWILFPVDYVGRARKYPIKFSIADFLCLFVTVQLPLSAAAWFRSSYYSGRDYHEVEWLLVGLAWLVGPLIWLTAASAISRAGIYHGLPRVAFMGVIVPVVYYGLVPFTIGGVRCISLVATGEGASLLTRNRIYLILAVLLGCGLVLAGIFTRRILASAQRGTSAGS